VELLLSLGLASAYIGLVSSIVLEALSAGALTSAANAATFSGFMHLMRIFGGQIGVAAMTRFIAVREQFHSNMLGSMYKGAPGLPITGCGFWRAEHCRGPLMG
jgi:DHA2 family multidrug resistance protein